MSRYLRFSLLLVLFSLGVHAYLTLHYYKVHFAKDLDSSICNLSATFSCDSVAISPFSALMGIPLSLFGGLVHVVLLALLIWIVSGFAEETARLKRYSLWLSGFIALASVVMGFISITQLSTYCIFCIAAYVLSFLTLFTLWKSQDKVDNLFSIQEGLRGLFTHSKLVLVMLLAVPVLAFILHKSLLNHYRGGSSSVYWEKRIQIIVNDWQAREKFEFPAPPSLVKGPPADQAVMTVVEFADFFCGFCKKFAPRMKLLADSNPDVRFEFYNFPLDGSAMRTSREVMVLSVEWPRPFTVRGSKVISGASMTWCLQIRTISKTYCLQTKTVSKKTPPFRVWMDCSRVMPKSWISIGRSLRLVWNLWRPRM